MTPGIKGNLACQLFHEKWSFRPWADEGHVSSEYVEELGNLVQARLAKPSAHGRVARIILRGPDGPGFSFCVFPHRPEFVHRELTPFLTDAALPVDGRSGTGEPDDEGQEDPHGKSDDHDEEGHNEVDEPLQALLPGLHWLRQYFDQRKAVHVLSAGHPSNDGIKVRHQFQGDRLPVTEAQYLHQVLPVVGTERNEHILYMEFVDQPWQILHAVMSVVVRGRRSRTPPTMSRPASGYRATSSWSASRTSPQPTISAR